MPYLTPVQADQAADLALWVAKYFDHDGLIYDKSVSAAIAELVGDPSLGSAWFIVADGAIVGYSVMTFGFDHEAGGRLGVVTDFYIQEPWRGQGIGSAVLTELIAYAKSSGLKMIELFVLRHNDRARRLYETFGFRVPEDREYLSLHFASHFG